MSSSRRDNERDTILEAIFEHVTGCTREEEEELYLRFVAKLRASYVSSHKNHLKCGEIAKRMNTEKLLYKICNN